MGTHLPAAVVLAAPPAGSTSELLLEVSKATDGVTATDGLVIDDELDGRRGAYRLLLTLHLCLGATDSPECAG
ncbi:hypothetical protein [Modestobacter sp. SYSU DS0875]